MEFPLARKTRRPLTVARIGNRLYRRLAAGRLSDETTIPPNPAPKEHFQSSVFPFQKDPTFGSSSLQNFPCRICPFSGFISVEMKVAESTELWRDYREKRSEPAFRELVDRYLNLVYSTALRRVGGDTHRAQDVSQIVFTDLARKAPALPESLMLG